MARATDPPFPPSFRRDDGAILAVAVIALVPFWLGLIPGGPTLGLDMLLMVPAMLLVMFSRVDEYSEPHRIPAKPPRMHRRAITH
jgi:hypothetical protein